MRGLLLIRVHQVLLLTSCTLTQPDHPTCADPIAETGSKIAFAIVFLGLCSGGFVEEQLDSVAGKELISLPDPGKEGRELRKKGEETAKSKKVASIMREVEAGVKAVFG